MEDDGYWKDLEEAFLDCKRMGVPFHSDDELWELAKKMVQIKYENVKAVERAIREGRPINDILVEDMKKSRLERKEKETN